MARDAREVRSGLAVYRLLEEGVAEAAESSLYFAGLIGDKDAATTDWYKRLAR